MNFNIIRALAVAFSDMLPLSGNGTERIADMLSTVIDGKNTGIWLVIMAELGITAALILRLKDRIGSFGGQILNATEKIHNKENPFCTEEIRGVLMFICASLPMAAWYFLRILFAPVYANLLTVVLGFLLSGLALVTEDVFSHESCPENTPGLKDAMVAGAFRLIGYIPGISGTAGMLLSGSLCGFSREYAYELAMLTCIPFYAGDILMKLKSGVVFAMGSDEVIACAFCFAVSFVGAYFLYSAVKKLYIGRKLRVFSVILFIQALFTLILWMRG